MILRTQSIEITNRPSEPPTCGWPAAFAGELRGAAASPRPPAARVTGTTGNGTPRATHATQRVDCVLVPVRAWPIAHLTCIPAGRSRIRPASQNAPVPTVGTTEACVTTESIFHPHSGPRPHRLSAKKRPRAGHGPQAVRDALFCAIGAALGPVARVLGRSTPFAAGRWRVRPVPRQVISAFDLLLNRWMTGSCR
jgi:hypothetical protein